MLKMKKSYLLIVSLFVALMFIVSGCGGGAKSEKKEEKKVVLRLGHEMPETHTYHKGAMMFADMVAKKTNGSVTVKIYPNGTLGKQAQLVEGLAQGTIDLALTNTPVLENMTHRWRPGNALRIQKLGSCIQSYGRRNRQ